MPIYNVIFFHDGTMYQWSFEDYNNACNQARVVTNTFADVKTADVCDGFTGEVLVSYYANLDSIDRDLFDLEREILG